jgi:hypothetical protein
LFGFFGFAKIPGAMQALVLAAITALQVILLRKNEKPILIDVIIFPLL